MLANSQDIWTLRRVRGSHHVYKKAGKTLVLPHPKKELGKGLVHAIYMQAGWEPD